ncbi:MAG TPA: peptidase C14, caspase catalytic subunit p20 [Cyanobacteria bacterium UBA11149]|nr:peptidase C14, caspase catalytic subunit p20 [Cyanobacteria bacterium UBA11367]HBE60489.1 peptidase C14, caspase catalytic subunit p20 [Cyanobacteria bacterium UBA11366]HBK63733.1 peptidase C14, caspase catalytic subunit p20 [Cyanobacteria bacterium UBA11166]HBR72581.1 peptidase C14, caspase catalytic subunit p20 [Cyanobacteria bacterium UBA11159]HBS71427.1 peptidase C14, caspase catalytic subunit p20 [Cyanobacteria bacterium UBA11153]HBW92435.1 peptidase C14, caspase catalytic subunit p20 
MPQINRRHFLQFAGSTLATLGLSQLDIEIMGKKYARILAQTTPRKLALLVGINAYQNGPLQGCVTDVKLQEQLLIHRFGFNPKDIVILTDKQATRQGMLDAFEEHLIKQAKPGDVVVYHFSGHGSQVKDPDCDFPDCLNSTFVPIDGILPAGFPSQKGAVADIMGHTLFLLMSALQTENVTVVLDSCHSGGGTRGNFRVRSRSGGTQLEPLEIERNYQQQWLSKLNLSPAEFKRRRIAGVAKGVVIASTKRDQLAADASFNDFYAGAFTYLMTQYLWQQTANESFSRAIPTIASNTTRYSFTSQEPLMELKPGSNYGSNPVYFIKEQTPPAEAVITKIEGNRAELWLGGLAPRSLLAFQSGAILSVVDSRGIQQGRVKLESRRGLVGQATLLDTAKPGAFLQESTRSIPSDLTLKIGLDYSLSNEINLAKEALAAMSRIEPLPLQKQEVQYIFGRITDAYRQALALQTGINLPEIGSLGLFSPGLEVIPNSFGKKGETVTDAIKRLNSKLKSLLAAHIVKTILNPNSSRLNLVASMSPEGSASVIASTLTIRGSLNSGTSNERPSSVSAIAQKLPVGTSVQLQVTNQENSPIYLSVLAIDPTGEISVLFPNQWTAAVEVTLVEANQTLKIPDPEEDKFKLVVQEPKGVVEILILASRKPLRTALQAIQAVAKQRGVSRGVVNLSGDFNDPAVVIDGLLDDINAATTSNSPNSRGTVRSGASRNTAARNRPPTRQVDTSQLAALSITFEAI